MEIESYFPAHFFQYRELDREHLAISADAIRYKLEDILQMNVDKLKKKKNDIRMVSSRN